MLQLSFEVIPKYLAYHLLINREPTRFVDSAPHPGIVDFQNKAWNLDRETCEFIQRDYRETDFLRENVALGRRVSAFIDGLMQDDDFAMLMDETLASLTAVQEEWERNFFVAKNHIDEITGTSFDGNFKVALTHPALRQGHYQRTLRTICWAARDTFANYNTVYLWHELLHEFLPDNHLGHAIIQLIADNDLRVKLSGGTYPPFEGHPELKDVMLVLMPFWQDFLQNKTDANIFDFCERTSKHADVEKLIETRLNIDGWR